MRVNSKGFLVFVPVIIFINRYSFAQNKTEITPGTYKAVHDSLLAEKQQLDKLISQIKTEIDSLSKLSESKSNELTGCSTELAKLKRKYYIKKYGTAIADRISSNRIWKSMTEQMLRDSWGEPDKVTKNVEKWGVFKQLYYGDVTFFFQDGKLISWEEKGKESKVETFLLH